MSSKRVEQAIEKGLLFLRSAQTQDGSFENFSSRTKSPFTPKQAYRTTFAPSLILAALNPVEDAADLRRALAGWLLKEKSGQWSFNYWAKAAPERTTLPYPDDLDDTFCALIALYEYDAGIIDGTALGSIVKLLLATETRAGGPYRTWLVDPSSPKVWRDVDLAVNSNIAYFLSLVADPLPNLTALLEQAITDRSWRSPYYPSPYPLAYYAARTYRGQNAAVLAEYLYRKQRQGWWGNALDSALAITALTRLGHGAKCGPAVERLLSAQLADGSWPAGAFWLDPALKDKAVYCGAPALTTALALEALTRFNRAPPIASPERNRTAEDLHARILSGAENELRLLDPSLRKSSLTMIKRIQGIGSHNEITLLPYLFNAGLVRPLEPKSTNLFEHLGLANLYGWAAYTIYDDFLDDEGQPPLLPVATVALRRSLAHFRRALPGHSAFQRLVEQTFDQIDAANAWEVTNCRFAKQGKSVVIKHLPNYAKRRRLAERSLGHTLTPLAVLAASSIKLDAAPAQHLRQALQHYLIARQLNDDMHDWTPDMQAGHSTYVVTAILNDLGVKPGKHQLEPLLARMQEQFWHHSLLTLCETILEHTALARRHVQKSGLLQDGNIVITLVDGIEAVVATTRQEQTRAKQFLAAYQTTHP